MADLYAYNSALAHAHLLWPKTRGNPRAQSIGFPCSVYQLTRSRENCTLMTPWEDLLSSAVVWERVRLSFELELIHTEEGRKTEDVIVLKQNSLEIFTFRSSDLEAATLAFFCVQKGGSDIDCMVLDVRPLLADKESEAFSYVIEFQEQGHARLVHNHVKRSWYVEEVQAGDAGSVKHLETLTDDCLETTIDVNSFLCSSFETFTDKDSAQPGVDEHVIACPDSNGMCEASEAHTPVIAEDYSVFDTDSRVLEESLIWDDHE